MIHAVVADSAGRQPADNNDEQKELHLISRAGSQQAAVLLAAIGTIASQAAVLTAVLYYVGWARTQATLGYFGVDPKLIGYSTEDYLLRSLNSFFGPFIVTTLVGLCLIALHHSILKPRAQSGSRWTLRLLRTGMILGLAISAIVCVRLAVPKTVTYPRGLLLPLALLIAITLLVYCMHLRALHETSDGRLYNVPRKALQVGLLSLGVIGAMWFVAQYAQTVGEDRAKRIVAGLRTDPEVVIYSGSPLAINGLGVQVAAIGKEGDKYRYSYSGLRLLVSGNGKFVVIASGWRKGEGVHILPDDGSFRIDIAPRY